MCSHDAEIGIWTEEKIIEKFAFTKQEACAKIYNISNILANNPAARGGGTVAHIIPIISKCSILLRKIPS